MVNSLETKKIISGAELAEKNIESLPPPDLNTELKNMLMQYYTLAENAIKKGIRGQETTTILLEMGDIKYLIKKKIEKAENQHYQVSGTTNYIVIKNRSDKFKKINFVYFLVNENENQLTNEYSYIYLLENYFLVAKLEGGLLTFIDKETGLVLNNKRYEQVKIITRGSKKEIIALTNNKWYWICSDPQRYKNRYPLASEISNGYLNIDFSDDEVICGYDNNLSNNGRMLTPQTIRDSIAA